MVLRMCEMWTFTLREERRPKVIEKMVLRKRDEVTPSWRKSCNVQLRVLYFLAYISRVFKQRRREVKFVARSWWKGKCIRNFGVEHWNLERERCNDLTSSNQR